MSAVTDSEFRFSETFEITPDIKSKFDENGFILVRGLLDCEEISKLKDALENDEGIRRFSYEVFDAKRRPCRLCLWSHPGNDITGMVCRCEKVVTTSEKLLDGEVYHYHTKLMMKMPRTGGAHEWHQDYGYWYKNGNLFPDMLTVFIPVDPCTKGNGCLQVIPKSQKCGRIEHLMVGGQTGADGDRVKHLQDHLGVVHVEMAPGDALFFHCNLLHRSDPNESDSRRWAFLCAYNRASNNPVYEHHHPQYTPLTKVSNSAIRSCTNITDLSGKDFLNPKDDKTTKVLEK